jgi:flagellar biosynthesis/type III secretory pathway protein FliH
MAGNGAKERAEEIRKAGEATAEELRRTSEEFANAAGSFDLKGMSKAWTRGYLYGLEALFFTQEQTEGLLKETVTQGIGSSQQILESYEKWLEAIQDQAGAASPFIEWSRQLVRTVHDTAEPLVKTAVDTTEHVFNYYENSLARPSRSYAINLNKTVMDTIVPA